MGILEEVEGMPTTKEIADLLLTAFRIDPPSKEEWWEITRDLAHQLALRGEIDTLPAQMFVCPEDQDAPAWRDLVVAQVEVIRPLMNSVTLCELKATRVGFIISLEKLMQDRGIDFAVVDDFWNRQGLWFAHPIPSDVDLDYVVPDDFCVWGLDRDINWVKVDVTLCGCDSAEVTLPDLLSQVHPFTVLSQFPRAVSMIASAVRDRAKSLSERSCRVRAAELLSYGLADRYRTERDRAASPSE